MDVNQTSYGTQRSVSLESTISLSTIASRLSIPEPWEHKAADSENYDAHGQSTLRHFRRGRQRWRVFLSGLWQVLLTTILCLALFWLCYAYSKEPVLLKRDANIFNTFNIGLSMLLGMALSSAFKGFAQSLRWQLLSTRYFGLREFDQVMQCESLLSTMQLLWTGRVKGRFTPSRVQWYCVVSLALNLGLQVVVAAIGLYVPLEISDKRVNFEGKCYSPVIEHQFGIGDFILLIL
jgi:hypothetical protein